MDIVFFVFFFLELFDMFYKPKLDPTLYIFWARDRHKQEAAFILF